MTPRDFTYFLRGFSELVKDRPTEEQWKEIKDHLNICFNVEINTPLVDNFSYYDPNTKEYIPYPKYTHPTTNYGFLYENYFYRFTPENCVYMGPSWMLKCEKTITNIKDLPINSSEVKTYWGSGQNEDLYALKRNNAEEWVLDHYKYQPMASC